MSEDNGNNSKNNGKGEIRGFFASLRMTTRTNNNNNNKQQQTTTNNNMSD